MKIPERIEVTVTHRFVNEPPSRDELNERVEAEVRDRIAALLGSLTEARTGWTRKAWMLRREAADGRPSHTADTLEECAAEVERILRTR